MPKKTNPKTTKHKQTKNNNWPSRRCSEAHQWVEEKWHHLHFDWLPISLPFTTLFMLPPGTTFFGGKMKAWFRAARKGFSHGGTRTGRFLQVTAEQTEYLWKLYLAKNKKEPHWRRRRRRAEVETVVKQERTDLMESAAKPANLSMQPGALAFTLVSSQAANSSHVVNVAAGTTLLGNGRGLLFPLWWG